MKGSFTFSISVSEVTGQWGKAEPGIQQVYTKMYFILDIVLIAFGISWPEFFRNKSHSH